jgi:hypothetical protein
MTIELAIDAESIDTGNRTRDSAAGGAPRQRAPTPMTDRYRIEIVGGGFGGLAAAPPVAKSPLSNVAGSLSRRRR